MVMSTLNASLWKAWQTLSRVPSMLQSHLDWKGLWHSYKFWVDGMIIWMQITSKVEESIFVLLNLLTFHLKYVGWCTVNRSLKNFIWILKLKKWNPRQTTLKVNIDIHRLFPAVAKEITWVYFQSATNPI